jgi:hypothetical protein
MGKCDKCGEESYALHVTGKHYKFLCQYCYCTLYRDCIDECNFVKCPNKEEIKE